MSPPRPAGAKLTGVILAGGASRRMGGQDKGLALLGGRPLIAWVVAALAPQVDEVVIVANRNLELYRSFGHTVVSDLRSDFPGPLAGLEAAFSVATHDWLLTCPVDAPLLPPHYAETMCAASTGQAVVAWIDGYLQPVFALLPRSAQSALDSYLASGARRATTWAAQLDHVELDLGALAAQLSDADTPEALAALNARAEASGADTLPQPTPAPCRPDPRR